MHGPEEAAKAERASSAPSSARRSPHARRGGAPHALPTRRRSSSTRSRLARRRLGVVRTRTARGCRSWMPSSRAGSSSPAERRPAGAIEQGGAYVNNAAPHRLRTRASRRPTSSMTASCCCGEGGGTTASCASSEREPAPAAPERCWSRPRGGSPRRAARSTRAPGPTRCRNGSTGAPSLPICNTVLSDISRVRRATATGTPEGAADALRRPGRRRRHRSTSPCPSPDLPS